MSRKPEYELKEGEDAVTQQNCVVLKPRMLQLNTATYQPAPIDAKLFESIASGQQEVENVSKTKENLQSECQEEELQDFAVSSEGLVMRKGSVYVADLPSKLKVMYNYHESLLLGHFGVKKTMEPVARHYWWPQQRQFIRDYIRSCTTWRRVKNSRHRPYGLLLPLPPPESPWEEVTMDFITDLPNFKGFC